MMSDSSYRLALRLLFWGNLVARVDSTCTLCYGEEEPSNLENGFLGTGVSCEATNNILGSTPAESKTCGDIQMEAYRGCGCPSYDEDTFCPMCSDSSFDIPSPLVEIPIIDMMTCERALFVRKESGLCDATRRAAYFCGCPGAPEPTCFYCSNGEKPTHPNRILPPHYNVTCDDLNVLAPFYTTDECPSLTADIPLNVDRYCGCDDGIDPDNGNPADENTTEVSCSLCGNVTTMALPEATFTFEAGEMTCMELSDMAETSDDGAFCSNLKDEYFDFCCLGITSTPTTSPAGETPTLPEEPAEPTTGEPTSGASRVGMPLLLVMGLLSWSLFIKQR